MSNPSRNRLSGSYRFTVTQSTSASHTGAVVMVNSFGSCAAAGVISASTVEASTTAAAAARNGCTAHHGPSRWCSGWRAAQAWLNRRG